MKLRTVALGLVVGAASVGVGLAVGMWSRGYSVKDMADMASTYVEAKRSQHSVADRVRDIEARKPELKEIARAAGGKLRILAFKKERRIEVHAPGWEAPREYAMLGFSGTLGPKLQEGDMQIPEGIYGISYLNPNSKFHLSLKVSYPNASDRARAKKDNRTDLGGDIMIHGKNVTIGCIPIGDAAIEEVFYLAAAVGIGNVSVVIAPYDMRAGRTAELEKSPLDWYPALCDEIAAALK